MIAKIRDRFEICGLRYGLEMLDIKTKDRQAHTYPTVFMNLSVIADFYY